MTRISSHYKVWHFLYMFYTAEASAMATLQEHCAQVTTFIKPEELRTLSHYVNETSYNPIYLDIWTVWRMPQTAFLQWQQMCDAQVWFLFGNKNIRYDILNIPFSLKDSEQRLNQSETSLQLHVLVLPLILLTDHSNQHQHHIQDKY